MNTRIKSALSIAALSAILTGCNVTGALKPEEPIPDATPSGVTFTPNTDAGIEVKRADDPTGLKLKTLVSKLDTAGSFGHARSDPFALTTIEREFETKQESERVLGIGGGFGTYVTPKPEVDEALTPEEPQPYRRLSGIVVGDSVLAILEEQGKEPIIITPGMTLPGTNWKVVSIDQDKAVLRRPGSVRPNQVIVRLETSAIGTTSSGFPGAGLPGAGGGGGGGGYQGRGPNGAGYPGGAPPPPGYPGGGGR